MTSRKFLDRDIEISFIEDDENDDYFYEPFDLDASCEKGSFFNNKSEVLWSRDENDFFKDNYIFEATSDSYSDSGRTFSSCSWHNDEFDMKSATKVKSSLEGIEDALYERRKQPQMLPEVFEECCNWSEKFLFLRLKGKQIVKPLEDSVMQYPSTSVSRNIAEGYNNLPDFRIEGKKMTIHIPEKCSKSSHELLPNNADCIDEVVEEHGEYEECFALDENSEICPELPALNLGASANNVAFLKSMQEKVVEKLALKVWPNVMNMLKKLSSRDSYDCVHLPQIKMDHSKPLFYQRPRTEGNGAVIDFPKLESIMTVSPKVLQWKSENKIGVQRPSSERTRLFRNSSSKSSQLPSQQRNKSGTKSRNSPVQKESQDLSIFLPALEEDTAVSVDVLRGTHIEPEVKSSAKPPLSSRTNEAVTTVKTEGFLPPIDNKDNVRNMHHSESRSHAQNNKEVASSKPVSNSRPSTSTPRNRSSKLDSGQRPISRAGYFSLNKQSYKNIIHGSQKNTDVLSIDENSGTYSPKLTLFPTVTSLVPYKERHYSSIRKGDLFSTNATKR